MVIPFNPANSLHCVHSIYFQMYARRTKGAVGPYTQTHNANNENGCGVFIHPFILLFFSSSVVLFLLLLFAVYFSFYFFVFFFAIHILFFFLLLYFIYWVFVFKIFSLFLTFLFTRYYSVHFYSLILPLLIFIHQFTVVHYTSPVFTCSFHFTPFPLFISLHPFFPPDHFTSPVFDFFSSYHFISAGFFSDTIIVLHPINLKTPYLIPTH